MLSVGGEFLSLSCLFGLVLLLMLDRHFNGEESFDTGPMAPPGELPASNLDTGRDMPGTKL